jgi:hypothetical protein
MVVPPQQARVLFVDYSFGSPEDAPKYVMHHLYFDGAANPVTTTPVAGNYTVTPCSISASGPITIGPPLKGKNWIVLNGAVNDSYVDYGSEILAVADGTVTGILDGQDANAPGVLPAEDPVLGPKLTVDNVDGNHIVLDIGNGA